MIDHKWGFKSKSEEYPLLPMTNDLLLSADESPLSLMTNDSISLLFYMTFDAFF
ncbi:MAG: hypothetical protein BWY67_00012 [Bacteroidetes bacterium ADurb.Bin397]|nr:MAG: hypothetical protein BWY67_00012 [Bacteroidetes bacterium ADurb.Bin397]